MDTERETRSFENPGLAALKATMGSLTLAVQELNADTQKDHDSITELRASMHQLVGETRQLVGAVNALQQQLAPNVERIQRETEAKFVDAQRLGSLHTRMDVHEKIHEAAWSKLGSGLFWIFASIVGVMTALLGDWLKKLMGIKGP